MHLEVDQEETRAVRSLLLEGRPELKSEMDWILREVRANTLGGKFDPKMVRVKKRSSDGGPGDNSRELDASTDAENRGPVEFNHAISFVNKVKASCIKGYL